MSDALASAMIGVLLVEFLIRLRLDATVGRISVAAQRAIDVLKSKRVSDRWKEKILLAYSWRLARASLVLGTKLLLVAGAAIALCGLWTATGSMGGSIAEFLLGPTAILAMSLVGSAYFFLRRYLGSRAL